MPEEATITPAAGESTADSTPEAPATEAAAVAEGEKALGDAGKKALDAMKAERNAAKAEAKAAADELARLKAAAEGKQAEFEAQQKAREVEAAALAKANERILKAEVRAAATAKLADPQDALRFLDLSAFEVGADGEIDSAAVASAIDNLIKSKPYLAAQGGTRFQGSADGGARKDATKVAQLTRADMAGMTPEQISDAFDKGQFADLTSGK